MAEQLTEDQMIEEYKNIALFTVVVLDNYEFLKAAYMNHIIRINEVARKGTCTVILSDDSRLTEHTGLRFKEDYNDIKINGGDIFLLTDKTSVKDEVLYLVPYLKDSSLESLRDFLNTLIATKEL